MEYPQINLQLEALLARADQTMHNEDLFDLKFQIDDYRPGAGGIGHFHGDVQEWRFADLQELCDIIVNQLDLPAEAFYYQDALATCAELEQDLRDKGLIGHWKDQMIISEFTGKHPARAQVCYYQPQDSEVMQAVAVLRDGTTIKHFRPWQHN